MNNKPSQKLINPFSIKDILLFMFWGFVAAVVLRYSLGISKYISWTLALIGIVVYRLIKQNKAK